MNKDKELSLDDASRELDKGVAGADALRVAEMERLQTVLGARGATLRREHARLARKLGETHPRVAEAAARVELNRGLLGDVKAETERARTELPDADEKTWVLHGYVRDENGAGVAGLTVALYDERAAWVEQLGFACTRANGYFRLTSQNFGNVNRPVFIRVLDNKGTHLYEDDLRLTPTGGQVDYREITLAAGARACAPPGESRNDPVAGSDKGDKGDAGSDSGGDGGDSSGGGNSVAAGGGTSGGSSSSGGSVGTSSGGAGSSVGVGSVGVTGDSGVTSGGSSSGGAGRAGGASGGDNDEGVDGVDDDVAARGAWVVRGRVTDAQGAGVPGLIVRLYDKDFLFDDRLGKEKESVTDGEGRYRIEYHASEFRDFLERRPDLYLKVFDRQGKMLYSSEREVRHEAGRVETIDVRVGGK